MPDNVKIDSVLICDDIRREDNGKAILIGVYIGNITLSSVPAGMMMSLWITGKMTGREIPIDLKVEIEAEEKNNCRTYEQKINVTNNEPDKKTAEICIALMRIPVEINSEGTLKIKVKGQDSKAWKEITSKNIIIDSSIT